MFFSFFYQKKTKKKLLNSLFRPACAKYRSVCEFEWTFCHWLFESPRPKAEAIHTLNYKRFADVSDNLTQQERGSFRTFSWTLRCGRDKTKATSTTTLNNSDNNHEEEEEAAQL